MPVISSFEVINIVVPEPCIFFWVRESVAYAAAVIPIEAKIFFVNGTAGLINEPAIFLYNEPKIPPDWAILDICVLNNFISTDILFSNAFLSLVFGLVV